ncbi:hypothetical protein BSCH_00781 [Candidatus Paraburkholderia schumanniana]|nr:hypothetical protein BSCH_00781 [Candidatus Paraburkholderia schumannianae]
MVFSLIPLAFSLTLLALTLFICRTINASHGVLRLNGALYFFTLCLVAMLLDFALTMVFASASFHDRTEYEGLASRTAWSGRILTYLIPCAISLLLALRFRRRQRLAYGLGRGRKPGHRGDSLAIQTSPYTESEMPL